MPCGASYAFNTIVTLTAVPDPGSTFAGWGGGCANVGTNPTCAVGLPGDRFAFAYFTKTPGTIATTYYHTDVVGSVRALSDQTGATVIRHDYLPFGEDTQPLAGDPLRFAGKELDPESALMNFEARYYRNTWGRFTQVDPIAGSPADPQSWNRYAYARNAPARFVDPNGEQYRVGIDCPFAGDGSRACPSEPPGPFGGPYGNFGGGFGTGSDKCDWGPCGLRKVVPHVIWGRRFLPAPKPAGDNDHTESSDGAADDNNNHHDPDPNKPCDSPPAPPGVDLKKNISAAESVRAFSGAMGEPWLKYFWFAEMSDTGRPFDFKKGGHKEFQDYGNWHYGVLGAALHIPEDVLFRGAGYVQWRNRGPNYDPAWGVPWGSAPYGDDPERDVPWIATGYNYYKSCNG
jgi:RHS repeat-associated protein